MLRKKKQAEETEGLYQGYKREKEREKFSLVEPGDEPDPWEEEEEPKEKGKAPLYVGIAAAVIALGAILTIGTNSDVKRAVFGEKRYTEQAESYTTGTDAGGEGMIAASDPSAAVRTDVVQGRQVTDASGAMVQSEEELAELIDRQVKESVTSSLEEAGLTEGIQGVPGERGEQGEAGTPGVQGIQGEKGETGAQGIQGIQGEKGETGAQGVPGKDGKDGKSVYELAKEGGYTGTEQELMESLSTLGIDMSTLQSNMDELEGQVNSLNSNIMDFEESFQAGCNEIEQALADKGLSPESNSPEDLVAAISSMSAKPVTFYISTNGAWTYNVKEKLPDIYSKLTKDDFLAFGSKISASIRIYNGDVYQVSGSANCAAVTGYDPATGNVSGVCNTVILPSASTTASAQKAWASASEVALIYLGTVAGK